ncbi:MAG TPA: hypothetical protein VMU87_12475 [Stellaceae bacterium]|nr:hypothetical protein [Stellaceae bacterium]
MPPLKIVHPTDTRRIAPTSPLQEFVRRWLTGRRGLIVGGIALVAAGLALGWNWLGAIGVAPFIIALAPCAAMCALGLCMNKMGGKSCSSGDQSAKGDAGAPVSQTSLEEVNR